MHKGPAGYDPSVPPRAEAYQTPKVTHLSLREVTDSYQFFWTTPEGYDVSTVEGAEAYLLQTRGHLPEPGGEIDAKTGYHLILELQREDRAATYDDGRRQNVAEHTAKLQTTTVWLASRERPDLDAGTVSIMAGFHDHVESYAGDTPIKDEAANATKPWREKAAMTLLRRDLADSPLLEILEEYENQDSPEARFVNAMDKVEAYQFSLNNKARVHRERWEDYPEVVREALPKAVIDHTAFDLMQQVLKHLGRKWQEWECMPFSGDPEAIVDACAEKVLDEYKARHAPVYQEPAQVYDYTGEVELAPGDKQREVDAEEAKQIGVALMSAYRARHDQPPTRPPATPASALEVPRAQIAAAAAYN